jgi:hypothetical protein
VPIKEINMFYYLYKIENTISGKCYIGVHKTNNLDDGYFGSGKILHQSIKKYGKENFRKTILEFFNTEKEMFFAESTIVTREFVASSTTYNIKVGGFGGWSYVHENGLNRGFTNKRHSDSTKKYLSELAKGREVSEATRKKLSENNFARTSPDEQRKHASEAAKKRRRTTGVSEDTRRKVSAKIKQLHMEGFYDNSHLRKFSNKGKRWINDGVKSKMVSTDLEIPVGWTLGRVKPLNDKQKR